MEILLFFLAVLPSLVLGCYVYRKDRVEKESPALLRNLLFYGVLSTLAAVFLELVFTYVFSLDSESAATSSHLVLFLYCFFGIGLCEEISKWLFTYFPTWKHREFNHVYDVLLYSVFVSIGFATFENMLYVFSSDSGLQTAILRAILSVPGHIFFAVFMGYYLGLAKLTSLNGNKNKYSWYMFLSVFVPTFLHACFDFCLFTGDLRYIIVFLVFVVCLYIFAFRTINKFSKVTVSLYQPSRAQHAYCQYCGQLISETNNFCIYCGNRIR